ncbi:MAG: hypothetical protein ACOX6V_01205 [Patescibacteria group bacterium]
MNLVQTVIGILAIILFFVLLFFLGRAIFRIAVREIFPRDTPVAEVTPTPAVGEQEVIEPIDPYTTAGAAQLAYTQAQAWSVDVVLWQATPLSSQLDSNWLRNDIASAWNFYYIDSGTRNIYFVQIANGVVTLEGEMTQEFARCDIRDEYPEVTPEVSLAEAGRIAVANGASETFMPEAEYAIETELEEINCYPVWILRDAFDRQTFVIDALDGEFLALIE